MILKRLELSGFKSFAKKSVLEFATPITAIVGPNGSGKSNIVEAFRFVLGEQSVKSMRGKRTDDLIFNGSKSTGRLNRARVAVVFDNKKRVFNADFDEISIAREIHRDSSNLYFINDTRVRLKDIVELLSAAHIGTSAHHIIAQGEADRILAARSTERKEMIEDALGLRIYHFKIAESERKLVKTQENMAQVRAIREELAPRLNFLKKQMKKLERAHDLKKELAALCQEYFAIENAFIRGEKERIDIERRKIEDERARLDREIAELKKGIEAGGERERNGELVELSQELSRVRREKEELSREMGRLEGIIQYESRREAVLSSEKEGDTIPRAHVEEIRRKLQGFVDKALGTNDLFMMKEFLERIRDLIYNLARSKGSEKKEVIEASDSFDMEKTNAELRARRDDLERKRTEEEELRELFSAAERRIREEEHSIREGERLLFEKMTERKSAEAAFDALHMRAENMKRAETSFEDNLREAAVLGGKEAIAFRNPEDVAEDFLREPRSEQDARAKNIERIKIKIEEFGAGGGDDIIKEYEDAKERDAFLEREIGDLEKSAETLGKLLRDLSEKLASEFENGLANINKEFQHFFEIMFGGGTARLLIVKELKRKRGDMELPEEDEVIREETGLSVEINHPRKRIRGLEALSGGERTLTSLALLFAVSQVHPPPFLVLDETDAALDETNSAKYGDMLQTLAKRSELIIITHNRETMARAGVLFGITMGQDAISKILSIRLGEAEEIAE
ncbi:AAA family ATPase [bacterium]|nr:AAA family ATPase [bacterium]